MHILLEVNLYCRDLLKWNAVNTVTNGPTKLAVFMGDRINKGFFQERNLWLFCQAAKKSGRNNKVTVQGCCLRNFLGALWAPEIKS